MRIAVYDGLPSDLFQRLQESLPQHEIIQLRFTELLPEQEQQWKDIEFAIGPRLTEDILRVANQVKILQVPWVGVDFLDLELMRKYNVIVTNSKWNKGLVAEYAVALLFACAKKLVQVDRELRKGYWTGRKTPSVQLTGKKGMLIGFGSIGQTIARLLSPYDMELYALKRRPSTVTNVLSQYGVKKIITWEEYDTYAPQMDFIILSLPLTPVTHGIMDYTRLQKLKNGVLFVNVGRGKTVDEEALYNAVKDGPIGVAGIDVWYQYHREGKTTEPYFPSKYPFHELPNVIMSPHRAASFYDAPSNFWDDVIFNIRAFLSRKQLRNVIDYDARY